jgi:hypothetical protein
MSDLFQAVMTNGDPIPTRRSHEEGNNGHKELQTALLESGIVRKNNA